MRLRVPAQLERQLAELQGSQSAVTGGVMIVPRMATPEEWEAEAQPQQRALMEWSMVTHGGAEVRKPAPEPMTAQQERAFEHQVHASRNLGLTEEKKAERAYAKARTVR